MTSQPLSLYFCYTQQDAAWQERFETHLIVMTRNGLSSVEYNFASLTNKFSRLLARERPVELVKAA